MTATAQAVRQFVESKTVQLRPRKSRPHWDPTIPAKGRPLLSKRICLGVSSITPKVYDHHQSMPKFLYKNPDGTYKMYAEEIHGENALAGHEAIEFEELIEASIEVERDIEEHLVNNLRTTEPGLELVERQHSIDIGRIDTLARETNGIPVTIEIKVGEVRDSVIG